MTRANYKSGSCGLGNTHKPERHFSPFPFRSLVSTNTQFVKLG